jgi:CelD/BcsL family acetyltransferase involved in cellulose biosynthesis
MALAGAAALMTVSDNITSRPGHFFEASRTNVLKATADDACHAAANGPAPIAITVHTDLAAVAAEWRAFEASAECTAFQTFLWHDTWQRHIGAARGVVPAIVVGRSGERTLFIAPLAVERASGVRQLAWHASNLCDYNAPLLAPHFWSVVTRDDFLASLFPAIRDAVARVRRFDLVSLGKMPERTGDLANPFVLLHTHPNASGAYRMQLGAEWESFYAAKRSSATRRRDRTKLKRLEATGAVRFATAEDAVAIASDLDVLFVQKSRSLAAMGARDFLAEPGVADFFRDVATADSRFVHVSHLMVGDTVAAVNLGLVFRGSYYHVLASHAGGAASKYGPGTVHLRELFAFAIGRGCRVFDFTIGDERYKSEWSDETLRLFDHRSAVTALGWLVVCPQAARAGLKRVIKQNPVLWDIAQKVRRLLRARRPAESEPPAEDQSD